MALPLIAAAAITALKMASDNEKERQSKKLRGAEIRFSPWTKLTPTTQVQYASPGEAAIGGFGTWMGMENMAQDQARQEMLDDLLQDKVESDIAANSYKMGWGGVDPKTIQPGVDDYVAEMHRRAKG